MARSTATVALWAKSGTGLNDWHPLIAHLLDVAASAAAILEQGFSFESSATLPRRPHGRGGGPQGL